jgi:putative membrane-bound dehydrogenase-like protein
VQAATVLSSGFALELVAAEPAVVDPVAITFDDQGRPYVAEYRDYPLGPPPGSPALSRIVRLDDADGDGFYEGSTVVADNVPFAQGVLAVRGGLLVTASPDVLFLADADGDGRADRREILASGFRVGNPQLRAGCPQLDIDNTVSLTGGLSGGLVRAPGKPAADGVSIDRRDVKIDLATGRITAASGLGQFGNAFDDLGRRFTTSNRNPLIAIRLPAEALGRNTFVDSGGGYEDAAPSGAASRVFPIAETNATAASHTGTHTSACGMTIFRGDMLGPEAAGDAFICEPVSHLVTRRRLRPQGAGFTSDHVGGDAAEFLASRDPWFRPVFTATGPDGALWVVDMCRRTVEHPEYMPAGLAETLDLRAGDRAGRIWRVVRTGAAARPWQPPATAAEAVALFSDPNGWRRSTAQRLLVERRFPLADAEAAVRAALATRPAALATVHCLWTLHGLGRVTADDVRAAAAAPDAGVRETGARLAPLVDPDGLAAEIGGRLGDDPDAHVRLAAVLAAAGSPAAAATTALAQAAAAAPRDVWIDRAVLSGAVGRSAPLLEAVAASPAGSNCEKAALDFVEKLAATAAGSAASAGADLTGDAAAARTLLRRRAAAAQTGCFDVALLAGLSTRLPPARLATGEFAAPVSAVIDRAVALTRDGTATPAARTTAIQLLGIVARGGTDRDAAAARGGLSGLLGGSDAAEVQAAAAAAIVRSGDTAAIAGIIDAIAGGGLEPTVRSAALTALADRRDAAGPLLAAIEERRIPAGVVPLDRRAALARSPDAAVREAAGRIWNSSAAGLSEQEMAAIVTAVRAGGDVERGRGVFTKHCAACHQAGGGGQQVGPALSEAADRPVEQIVLAIVEPNQAVEPRWESSVVLTEGGEVIEGIVAESGAESVVLVRAGGERRTVPRAEIESLHSAGRSLMPEGFGRNLQPAEIADLVAFLRGGRPVPKAGPATSAATSALPAATSPAPAAAAASADAASAVGSFRAGAHVEDISPTRFPVPVNGGMQRQLAAGIQDPMQARCLVLDDSTRRLVLVVVDACMIPREITEAAKALAEKETGIPAEHMLIAATHTHSAAALAPVFQCDVDPDYVATVAPRIARGIAAAVRNLEPAECGWAASSAPDQVFHRRWFVKPGRSYENPFGVTTDTVKMNPGAGSTLVSVPAGPVDQEVAIFAVRALADSRPLALFANYSLHYVGGVQPISADYFATFAAEISRRVGAGDGRYAGKPPFVAMLSNGTSGNVNNIDFALSPKHAAAPGSRIRVVASAVADAAEEAWAAIDWRSHATLDTAQEDLVLGVRKGSPAEIAQAKRWLESIPKAAGGQWTDVKAIYARETLALAEYPDTVPVMLQVHRIGELSIAAIPCEVFVETGLRLKRTSPFARHFTVSLANGYNGYLPQAADHPRGGYETWRARSSYLEVEAETKIVAAVERMAATVAAGRPPVGFTPLFNGKDLAGWKGLVGNPQSRAAMSAEELAAAQATADASMREHWSVVDGVLRFDGKGQSLCTAKDYGDFELYVDWKIRAAGDSGIYLRGSPQVQIWDTTHRDYFKHGAEHGSGGFWNNRDNPRFPTSKADRPVGEWNSFFIRMVGERATVVLNGRTVVDDVVMENAWDRTLPISPRGQIELQNHGNELFFRNISIREIPAAEANAILAARGERDAGFEPVFNGRDLAGWTGAVDAYEVADGAIVCKAGGRGTLFTEKEYGDFVARLEFRLPPGGNNGLAIRYDGQGQPHVDGVELQVLDSEHEKHAALDPRQHHGSLYGLVPAARGYLRPAGEWNFQEVTVRGDRYRVELNGFTILDTNLDTATASKDGPLPPGVKRRRGHFGFIGHDDPVAFRNVMIRELPGAPAVPPDRGAARTPVGGPVKLFNGENLEHFYVWHKETKYADPKRVFTVADGTLRVSGEGFGGLITFDDYRDYHLVIEFKWGQKTWGNRVDKARDSGLLVHCWGPDGGFANTWMASIEAQIIEGGVGDILVLGGVHPLTGRLYPASLTAETTKDRDGETVWQRGGERREFTTGRINWFGRDPDWKDAIGFRGRDDVESAFGEWTRMDVIAAGDTLVYKVNGVVVNEAFACRPSAGKILLQTEDAELLVRRLELWPLTTPPPATP